MKLFFLFLLCVIGLQLESNSSNTEEKYKLDNIYLEQVFFFYFIKLTKIALYLLFFFFFFFEK